MSGATSLCHRTGIYPIELPTWFDVGPVNVFLCKHEALTLVDAGVNTDAAWAALEHGLEHWGVTVRDLERIILTHHHIDHTGLLERILEVNPVEICAHPDTLLHIENDYSYDEEHSALSREFYASFGVPAEVFERYVPFWSNFCHLSVRFPVARLLEDAGNVGRFTAYFVPGHSPTDTLLVDPATGVTLSGDHILEHINPNPMLRNPLPGRPRPKGLVEYQASLARTRSLDLSVCLPGHGAPFLEHRRVIDGILAAQARRREQVRALLAPEGVTPYELVRILYPDRPEKELRLCLSVACGHLECLEQDGQATCEPHEGVWHYYPR